MENREGKNEQQESRQTISDAYELFGAKHAKEFHDLYVKEDQRLIKEGKWDYDNPELLINKAKSILEGLNRLEINEDENEWVQETLWFWHHHAISVAALRGDLERAREFARLALEYQPPDHPNKITRLLFLLVNDQYEKAKQWAEDIEDPVEKDTAKYLLEEHEKGLFNLRERT